MSNEFEYVPYAPRVSSFLKNDLGIPRYNANADEGGYRCTGWVDDEYGNPTVLIEYQGIRKDLGPGRFSEGTIHDAHRMKLKEIWEALEKRGYSVCWGWDPDSGETNTTFIVVVSRASAEQDRKADAEPEPEDGQEAPAEPLSQQGLETVVNSLLITLPQAEEAARAIVHAYNSGRDQDARRMEFHLMRAALVAIVSGSEDYVDLSAVALSTQHLFFSR